MPSFVEDAGGSPTKKRKESNSSNNKNSTSKPKKQQKTLASFFGVKKKAPPKTTTNDPPPKKPAHLLNDKRKAEVMRIVVGKQRKTKNNHVKKDDDDDDEVVLVEDPSRELKKMPSTMTPVGSRMADSDEPTEESETKNGKKMDEKASEPMLADETQTPKPKEEEDISRNSSIEAPDITSPAEAMKTSTKKSSSEHSEDTAGDQREAHTPKTPSSAANSSTFSRGDEQQRLTTRCKVHTSSTPTTPPKEDSKHQVSEEEEQKLEKKPETSTSPTKDQKRTSARKSRNASTPPKHSTNEDTVKSQLSEDEQLKLDKLRETYTNKGEALLEQFRQPPPEPTLPKTDQVDVIIATLIDGSHLPLSKLAAHVTTRLHELELDTPEPIEEKIKLLATRRQMIKANTEKPADLYETDSLDWRWEVQIADLVLCKKERSKRKRLANHYQAVLKLIKGIDAQDVKNISNLEEKVLKFEREVEKQRLAFEAKRAKELEKERKQREVAKKKEHEASTKLKKQKETEQRKLAKKAAEQRQKDAKAKALAKQESVLKNFLAAPKRAVLETITPVSSWNADRFRQEIQAGRIQSPPFAKLSERAKRSRVRRTRMVELKVLQTVEPENPFSQEPAYAEQTTVQLKNKYQFLCFHEDVRPPYWGTWSKRSNIVSGRTPFGQDTKYLDYENDSEAEWEEGDDEMGEDLAENDVDEDEVEEPEMEGEDDGWLAADDDDGGKNGEDLTLRYIAPSNGCPSIHKKESPMVGFSVDEAMDLLEKLTVIRLSDEPVCYDVEPPAPPSDEAETDDMLSDEHMAVFVRFLHNNSIGSRDKLIDEFLREHKSIASSRAQILRILDSIAEKTKDPLRGTQWVVKQELLDSLGLQDLGSEDERKNVEIMKEMAKFVHHHTAASKDKLADEIRDRFFPSKSRADILRLVQSIAVKKKLKSTIRWVVKNETRSELGLTLPDEPENDSSQEPSLTASTVTPTPTSARMQMPKAANPVAKKPLGSANLLKAFDKKE